tara:strand:+ start:9725 stop:10972 length:1248 start_codon:yes stop_codon:yes gene_type:complete
MPLKRNLSKHLFIAIIFALLGYVSFQFYSSKSLEGEWFALNYDYQNHWSIDDNLNLTINTYFFSEYFSEKYQIIRSDSNTYEILAREGRHNEELGIIEEYKKDAIKFSSGLELMRIKPTISAFSIDQFRTLLQNSTVEISYKYKHWIYTMMYNEFEVKTFLFPSSKLNRNGDFTSSDFTSTTKISKDHFTNSSYPRQGVTYHVISRSEPWSVYSINGMFVLQYGYHHYIADSYIIHSITDSSFSGFKYYDGNHFPFSARIVNQKNDFILASLHSQIIENDWKILATSLINLSWEYRLDHDLEDLERRKRNYRDELILLTNKSDLESGAFSFNFTNEGRMEIYFYGNFVEFMNWKMAPNGEFLFMFLNERYSSSDYIQIENESDNISKLSFTLPIYLQHTDSTYREEFLRFELVAQ